MPPRPSEAPPQDPRPVSPGDVRAQLDRILESRWFRNAQRLRRFLQFTVGCALEGTVDQLKESVLGRVVFDRGAQYDPRTDSIVRVESQRLRRRLRDYYENEGLQDPVSIAFYSGSYIPRFSYVDHELIASGATERVVGSRLNPLTIAVLPFENLSSESDQDFFCDGVTEDVIYALSRIPGVKVIGRTSMFALKGIAYDVRDTGARLGAGTIIDGSVRRSGSSVKIFAEMLDADTRQVRWADTFNRTMDDVFAVQAEIAQTIARVLQMELAPPVSSRLIRGAPSLDAYLLYLRGRYAWNRMSAPGLGVALDIFEQAISDFPEYASPYSGLADAYLSMSFWGELRPRDTFQKALKAAQSAMKLDPLHPHAYSSAATAIAFYEWKWEEGVELARKAIELEPSYSYGHYILGACLFALGRIEEANTSLEHSVALDPLSVRYSRMLGLSYYYQRQFSNAQKWIQNALEMHAEPLQTRYLLGRVLLAEGRYEPALEQARLCHNDTPDPLAMGLLGACHAYMGQPAEARDILEKITRLSPTNYVDPFAAGQIHLALGNTEQALESVHQMLEERTFPSVFLEMDPAVDTLRNEPRFMTMLTRLKGIGGN